MGRGMSLKVLALKVLALKMLALACALAAFPGVAAAATTDGLTIGVWDQPASSFATWSSRGINTIVGYDGSGVSFAAWEAALARSHLTAIRPPEQSLASENADPLLAALSMPLTPNNGGSYLTPQAIQQDYASLRQGAPSKPAFLLLDGAGIYTDPKPATYQAYAQGADWLADGIYPVNGGHAQSWNDLLHTSAAAPGAVLDELNGWSGAKPLYQFIEAANFSGSDHSRSPNTWELRGEIWDSLIHGARGIVYVPQSAAATDGTSPAIDQEITREDQLLALYAPVLAAPGGRIPGLAAPFEGAYHDYRGSRYSFVLNYSYSAASYRATDYAPFELGVYLNGAVVRLIGATTQDARPKPPAFVIGVSNQPPPLFPTWRARGINTIVGYQSSPQAFPSADGSSFTAWEAELGEQGLFAIRAQERADLRAENDDPRLLAIAQPDEPVIHKVAAATLLANYVRYHALAPGKPVFLNFSGGTLYTSYPNGQAQYLADTPAGDWISNDIYPVSAWNRPDWIDLNEVKMPLGAAPGGVVDALARYSGHKPQYDYIETSNQCFIWCFRAPTPDEMRGEIWDSVIHGVHGIIYFPQRIDYGFLFDYTPPELVSEMTRQDQLLTSFGQMLVAPGGPLRLPAPLEGAWRRWNGHRYELVLDYSHSRASFHGISMAPYTLLVFRDGSAAPVLVDGPATGTAGAARHLRPGRGRPARRRHEHRRRRAHERRRAQERR